ncbi:MAG: DUF6588 family protein [Pseudobdellovibrionaceae bacterium]
MKTSKKIKSSFSTLILSGLIAFTVVELYAPMVLADGPTFTSITSAQFDDISKELSANFTHASVQGPASLGNIFGFQLDLVGGLTQTPNIDTIVKTANSSSSFSQAPHGGIGATVSIPIGITAEVVFIPKTTMSDVSFQTTSFGLKLSMNQLIPVLPVNLSLRGIYSSSTFDFSQTVNSVKTDVSDKNSVTGIQLLLGPKVPIIEPYIGVGALSATNELTYTGSTIFSSAFTTSSSAISKPSSTQLLAGLAFNVALVNFGLEYSSLFGASKYTAKFGFGF